MSKPSNHSRVPVAFFDAVGTLIYPSPPAFEAYHSVSLQHGCSSSLKEIRTRFGPAFAAHFLTADTPYQVIANEENEKAKWKQVVQDVFQSSFTPALFDELWSHFADPANWQSYPDAPLVLDRLHESGIPVGLASNFDSRLTPIIQTLFPSIPESLIYCSTQIGFAKPDVRFFTEIELKLRTELGSVNPIMIGDNWRYDVEAPRRAGWNSIWKSSDQLPTAEEISSYFLRNT